MSLDPKETHVHVKRKCRKASADCQIQNLDLLPVRCKVSLWLNFEFSLLVLAVIYEYFRFTLFSEGILTAEETYKSGFIFSISLFDCSFSWETLVSLREIIVGSVTYWLSQCPGSPAPLSAHVSEPHRQSLPAQKQLCSGNKFRRNALG